MPIRDLRHLGDGLDPLAPFIVLSVMCYPRTEDRRDRERMLSTIRASTGVGKPRAAIMDNIEFMRELSRHAPRAGMAGGLFLTFLQLHARGEPCSLSAAIKRTRPLPDRWTEKLWPVFEPDTALTHMPHSRRKMLDAFNRYLPASHLWAALMFGFQNDRPDVFPDCIEHLPTFLAYAHAFAEMAERVPFDGRDRRVLLPRDIAWRFTLPDDLMQTVELEAQPLDQLSHPPSA
ncbi:MAG: hypothetical protein HQ514_11520 [Rhodospirillales bacterium]|nr:hypothetical protein [Rhodospirillales bacterium]